MAADSYISNAVQYGHDNDTDIIYGVVRNVAKQARDVANGAWDTYDGADLGDYDISAAVASGGLWSGDFPVEVANGFYIYQFRIRAGANPAEGDILVDSRKGYWNGSIFSSSALDANGRVDISKIEGVDATDQIVIAIKTMTGFTAGGTWTYQELIKAIAAYLLGTWQDKSGDPTTQEILDAEDDATVILEILAATTSPYKATTKK